MIAIRVRRRNGWPAALWLAVFASLGLNACASRDRGAAIDDGGSGAGISIDERAAVECAPFARALSGVQLRGAAADWWAQAEGRYTRTRQPSPGAVLVFRRSARLADGHVAVVSRIEGDRRILVTQANWVRDRVIAGMPVIDISPANDWTLVRVWWPPSGQMGAARIRLTGSSCPIARLSHDQLAADTPRAIRMASGTP